MASFLNKLFTKRKVFLIFLAVIIVCSLMVSTVVLFNTYGCAGTDLDTCSSNTLNGLKTVASISKWTAYVAIVSIGLVVGSYLLESKKK